jgi:oligosaccharide repeat unit polymerase
MINRIFSPSAAAWRTETPLAIGISRRKNVASVSVGIVVLAWLTTVLLHEVNIGGRWDFVPIATWLLIAMWIAAFAMGGTIGARRTVRSVPVEPQPAIRFVSSWLLILCAISVIGAALFVFDFAILRGYGFTTAAATIRLEEVQAAVGGTATSSPISGVGRLLIPAFLPACTLFIMFRSRLSKSMLATFLATSVLIFAEQLLFEGGRWFVTTVVVAMVLTFVFRRGLADGKSKTSSRGLPVIRLLILAIFLISFFAYVFVERVVQRSDYFATAYMQLASSYRLTINYDQLTWFEGPLGGLWFTICMLWLYATQGFNELDLILQQRYLDHAYGLYQVPQIGQIILLLTGVDIRYDALANLPTYGSYATFLGHSYIDIGRVGSVIFAFFLGYLMARAVRGMASGRISMLSMTAPALAILGIFSPVISLVPTLWPAIMWMALTGAVLRRSAGRTEKMLPA